MGIAAYNRGTMAISEQITREFEERRCEVARKAGKPKGLNPCEVCGLPRGVIWGPLGMSVNTWSRKQRRWIDACRQCASLIRRELK